MRQKIIIATIAVVTGVLAGYFIFRSPAPEQTVKMEDESGQIWTCSMHPQIRKTEPGDCPICGMDLIPLEELGSDDPLVFSMSPEAIKVAGIQTTILGESSENRQVLRLSGRIKADETMAASIVTHIPGRIEKLYVSFTGDRIAIGQKIARIYSPDLITAQEELLEAWKLREVQPALLEAAKNKMRYWKISDEVINRIIKEQAIREYFDIYADHSGVVSKRRVSVGDYMSRGGVLFDLVNLSRLWVVFDVYEDDLNLIAKGDEITFTTPSQSGKTFSSKVTFIDPLIDPATRTASVRLEVPNSANLLKPDMFVNGELALKGKRRAADGPLLVPKSAILWTGVRSVAYVRLPDMAVPSFEFREVLLGDAVGNNYTVAEGLYPGDEVVTNGAFVIDASAQLNNRASMMNRALLDAGTGEFRTPDFSDRVPEKFKEQLYEVMDHYLELKNDLVNSDGKKARLSSEKMLEALKITDMKLLDGQAHMYWMEREKELSAALNSIKATAAIKKQRVIFAELSDGVIKVAQSFGLYDKNYFVQFCSMANDKQGGYWLSEEQKILNPYFGDEMLTCGEVKDTIKKKIQKAPPAPAPAEHQH